MAKRYVLRTGLHAAVIPGAGKVTSGRVLEGAEYAKYVPSILAEIMDSEPVSPPGQLLVEPLMDTAPVRPAAKPVLTETKIEPKPEPKIDSKMEDKRKPKPLGKKDE